MIFDLIINMFNEIQKFKNMKNYKIKINYEFPF